MREKYEICCDLFHGFDWSAWRMLRAVNMLATTADPVGAIALALGYASESAFSAAFKRVMGRSPRQHALGHAQGSLGLITLSLR